MHFISALTQTPRPIALQCVTQLSHPPSTVTEQHRFAEKSFYLLCGLSSVRSHLPTGRDACYHVRNEKKEMLRTGTPFPWGVRIYVLLNSIHLMKMNTMNKMNTAFSKNGI